MKVSIELDEHAYGVKSLDNARANLKASEERLRRAELEVQNARLALDDHRKVVAKLESEVATKFTKLVLAELARPQPDMPYEEPSLSESDGGPK